MVFVLIIYLIMLMKFGIKFLILNKEMLFLCI